DGEDIPDERTAELRPHAHSAGVRKQPVSQPRTADVDGWENSGAGHGEQGHSFGKAVDGIAPRLPQQQENRGDERAGVADADPPHEGDDGEAPADGDGDAPNANAFQEQG